MIIVRNLRKKYGSKLILDNINIEIEEGKINFLLGKNGSGKTTFIKCLLNLESYSGEIKYSDKSYEQINSEVFAVFDDSCLYTKLTGYQNIKLLLSGYDIKVDKSITSQYLPDSLLAKKVINYSYGERKKLCLIVAEFLAPKIIIMDEISNGLDYETMVLLKKKIVDWSKNSTIILTGHQFDFYNNIIDNLYLVKDSHISLIEDYNNKVNTLEEIYEKNF